MSESPVIVLGGGLCGLAYAWHSKQPCVVLERESEIGGTARTHKRGEFLFDITGHWLHLSDPDTAAWIHSLFPEGFLKVQRRASVYSHGRLTPYPFQANTYGLPKHVVEECVLGYFAARETKARGGFEEPKNFEDFIRQRMGDGIAKHFMLPYNTKIWTVEPKDMAHDWCARFVPTPTPEEVVQGALAPEGSGKALGYNSSFFYPKEGGIATLAERVGTKIRGQIHTGAEVERIDVRDKTVRLKDGQVHAFSSLVSTLPLRSLIGAMVHAPENVRNAAQKLRSTQVTYWDIAVKGPSKADAPHWIYYPESDIPFYRVGSPSAAVPYVAPAGYRSYYVETSHGQDAKGSYSDQDILDALTRVGLRKADEEVVLCHKTTLPCAYVIMDKNYGECRSTILQWLKSEQILSIGRYGDWTYDSMEGALKQGRLAALQSVPKAR